MRNAENEVLTRALGPEAAEQVNRLRQQQYVMQTLENLIDQSETQRRIKMGQLRWQIMLLGGTGLAAAVPDIMGAEGTASERGVYSVASGAAGFSGLVVATWMVNHLGPPIMRGRSLASRRIDAAISRNMDFPNNQVLPRTFNVYERWAQIEDATQRALEEHPEEAEAYEEELREEVREVTAVAEGEVDEGFLLNEDGSAFSLDDFRNQGAPNNDQAVETDIYGNEAVPAR
jgi:hypothetical protein